MVYALVGLVIEGPDKLKWSEEALRVGVLVTGIILLINVLVMLYAFSRRLRISHLLWVSPILHIAIAVVLTIIIAIVRNTA